MKNFEEHNIIIKIEGISEEEIRTLYKDYLDHCTISHSNGSIGDIIYEISINPFYSALAANILAPIILNLAQNVWEKIKISVKISGNEIFENLTKEKLQELNRYIQKKYKS